MNGITFIPHEDRELKKILADERTVTLASVLGVPVSNTEIVIDGMMFNDVVLRVSGNEQRYRAFANYDGPMVEEQRGSINPESHRFIHQLLGYSDLIVKNQLVFYQLDGLVNPWELMDFDSRFGTEFLKGLERGRIEGDVVEPTFYTTGVFDSDDITKITSNLYPHQIANEARFRPLVGRE